MNNSGTTARSLDHFVINVGDIEIASAMYRHLGFRVMPVMEHGQIGTSNSIVQFQDTYLEFIGDWDHARVDGMKNNAMPWIMQGDVFWMTSLTSDGLESEKAGLAAQGIEMAPILSAARRVRLPFGGWDETDSRSSYLWNDDDILASLFLSDHRKPEAIWIKPYQSHPNSCLRVGGIRYLMTDPAKHAGFFAKVAGGGIASQSADRIRFETPRGEFLELATPASLHAQFPEAPQLSPDTHSRGAIFTIVVESLDTCRWALRDGGVPHRIGEEAILVGSAYGCGMAYEFVQGQQL